MKQQSPTQLFMVEPACFYTNTQTIDSNHYQSEDSDQSKEEILYSAKREFHNLKDEIEKNDIEVLSCLGNENCPDHIFPNWFTTFSDKTMQIFSMKAKNRRTEKTPEMISLLKESYELTSDYSNYENENIFLESTSSMVFDRVNKVAYIGVSPRTDKELAKKWCQDNSFEMVLFETTSHAGKPIYHSDVFMYVGTEIIGICIDVINEEYREMVLDKVSRFHDVMLINENQILDFCGNSLEARNKNNEKFIIMSTKALSSLSDSQKNTLEKYFKKIIHTDLESIEKYGGGSARCMLSELF
jgi:hypothetical protein